MGERKRILNWVGGIVGVVDSEEVDTLQKKGSTRVAAGASANKGFQTTEGSSALHRPEHSVRQLRKRKEELDVMACMRGCRK